MVTLRRHAIAVRLRSPAWRRPRPGTPYPDADMFCDYGAGW